MSRICQELHKVVLAFKERPIEGQIPYVWLDTTFPKVREGGRVRSMALVARGLKGVKLAISDAHEGLRKAIEQVLIGTTWQRCRVHFMRNVMSQVPKGSQTMVSSIIRTIFAQPSQESAREQLRQVVNQLHKRFPKAMDILEQAEHDVLAYMSFPKEHGVKFIPQTH